MSPMVMKICSIIIQEHKNALCDTDILMERKNSCVPSITWPRGKIQLELALVCMMLHHYQETILRL
jgi:hypothetical protein